MEYATAQIIDVNEPLEIALLSDALFEQYDEATRDPAFPASAANDDHLAGVLGDSYENLYPNFA